MNLIKEFEQKYPEMAQEIKNNMQYEYEFFIKKQLENNNISNITFNKNLDETLDIKLVISPIISRINNKLNKLINLIIDSNNLESNIIKQLLFDIIIYSRIALLINSKKWAK